jgi:hypothetical protein
MFGTVAQTELDDLKVVATKNAWPNEIYRLGPKLARNGRADRIERCPVLGVERKTSARREYFRF